MSLEEIFPNVKPLNYEVTSYLSIYTKYMFVIPIILPTTYASVFNPYYIGSIPPTYLNTVCEILFPYYDDKPVQIYLPNIGLFTIIKPTTNGLLIQRIFRIAQITYTHTTYITTCVTTESDSSQITKCKTSILATSNLVIYYTTYQPPSNLQLYKYNNVLYYSDSNTNNMAQSIFITSHNTTLKLRISVNYPYMTTYNNNVYSFYTIKVSLELRQYLVVDVVEITIDKETSNPYYGAIISDLYQALTHYFKTYFGFYYDHYYNYSFIIKYNVMAKMAPFMFKYNYSVVYYKNGSLIKTTTSTAMATTKAYDTSLMLTVYISFIQLAKNMDAYLVNIISSTVVQNYAYTSVIGKKEIYISTHTTYKTTTTYTTYIKTTILSHIPVNIYPNSPSYVLLPSYIIVR